MEKDITDQEEWPLLVSRRQAVGNCVGHAVGAARLGPAPCLYGHSRLKGWEMCRDPTATNTHKY